MVKVLMHSYCLMSLSYICKSMPLALGILGGISWHGLMSSCDSINIDLCTFLLHPPPLYLILEILEFMTLALEIEISITYFSLCYCEFFLYLRYTWDELCYLLEFLLIWIDFIFQKSYPFPLFCCFPYHISDTLCIGFGKILCNVLNPNLLKKLHRWTQENIDKSRKKSLVFNKRELCSLASSRGKPPRAKLQIQ